MSMNCAIICLFLILAGPTVEPTMRVSILSSRDTDPNVVFSLSFNVTFGPPSLVFCVYIEKGHNIKTFFFGARDHPNLSREVIRSYFNTSSQLDMTRVSVKVQQTVKQGRMYECEVTVEGRSNIASGTLTLNKKGSGLTNVMVTGE